MLIGLTKNGPETLNYLPGLFKEPLEKLKDNYFTTFGLGKTQSSLIEASTPMETYLNLQHTPDRGYGERSALDNLATRSRNTIELQIPTKS